MRNVSFLAYGILGLLILLGLVFIIVLFRLKKSGREPRTDYCALFIMGVIFIGAGVSLAVSIDNPGMYGLTALGVIYMIAGITHRDQWENNK
jgi:predicted membrane channel-forming protein YqfA (hemolysin III family)